MELHIKPGKYVVAVSGGVDSMVLLDILTQQQGLELTVAHLDHGIRPDSSTDRIFVEQAAHRYRLPFIYERVELGPQASEERARIIRYEFLQHAMQQAGAVSIITAHHQDDALETMLINLIRGTGRHGLSSLRSTSNIVRPLLQIPKEDLQVYAEQHAIAWHEDSTNQDDRYLRNHLRHHVMPRLSPAQRTQLIRLYDRSVELNHTIDSELAKLANDLIDTNSMERYGFIQLPFPVAKELMLYWLRQHQAQNLDRKQIERLVVQAKIGRVGTMYDVDKCVIMKIGRKSLELNFR